MMARDAGWQPAPSEFCDQCSGPYDGWLHEQYAGHWDTCPNRPKGQPVTIKSYDSAPTRHVPSPAELREDLARGGTGEYTSPGYGKPAPTVAPSVEAIYAALMDSRREGRRDDTVELVTREKAEAVAAADPRESVEDAERRGEVRGLRRAALMLRNVDPARDAVFWDGDVYEFVCQWLDDRATRLREGQR